MNNHPKISVVTVCYNAEKDLEKTILSVINQTYDNIEYIVIDGGSNDGTLSLLNRYAIKIDKIVSEPDNGIFDAMNKSLALVSGRWVLFMNAGDLFFNNYVCENIFFEDIKENIGFIHGSYMGQYPRILRKMQYVPFYKNKSRCRGMGFSHQAVFVRSDLAKKYGFNLQFKAAAEYNQISTIYKDGYQPYWTNVCISIMDMRYGFSQNNRKLQYCEEAIISGCYDTLWFKILLRYKLFKQMIKRNILYKFI